jgi:chromosome partitioning protein
VQYLSCQTLRHLITWVSVILTLASFKGGVGKTTSAIHLAAYFSRSAPTVLVDGDPNKTSAKWAARGNPPFRVVPEEETAIAARKHEHVIIDTKARPDTEHLQALARGCDLLILPCTPSSYSMDALTATIAELKTLGAERYRILLTIVPPRPMTDGEQARQLIVRAGLPLFAAEIRRTVAFERAALDGITVDQVKGNDTASLAWRDYERVAEEIEVLNGKAAKQARV